MKEKETGQATWKGMHNGSVAGKGFEKSRRNRKSHSERKTQIVHSSQKGK